MWKRQHLSPPTLAPPPVPSWFTAALECRPEHSEITVDGCRIHLRQWGSPERPPLVLVHGGAAHSGWWDHIAPFFSGTHRVIAPDLSGHGDSGTRETYRLRIWADEVLACAQAAGSSSWPTVVGHNMGGFVAAKMAQDNGEHVDSIVVIDAPLHDHVPEQAHLRRGKRRANRYSTKDEILARFRPVPMQETVLPYIAHHIAAESIRRTLRGWEWKFDPAIFDAPLHEEIPSEQEAIELSVAEIPCRKGYIRCEAGSVRPDMCARIRAIMELRGPFVELAEAGHHPMLDQPLPLVATLRTLLEMWSIT